MDVNDNAPMFQSSSIFLTISEIIPVSTTILNLVATDADFGNNSITLYSIQSEQSAANGQSIGGKEINTRFVNHLYNLSKW